MNRRTQAGRLGFWLLLIVGFFAAGIFMSSQNEQQAAPEAALAGEAAARADYALDARRADWPPLHDGSSGRAVTATNYYVVLDGSGSMRRSRCSGDASKMEAAVAALRTFVESIPADANLGLAVFDGAGVSERVALATANRPAFNNALSNVNASGGTPLLSAITLGYERLTAQGQQQLGYGEYHLVVVTDGQPDPEEEDPAPIVDRLLAESPVMLHTIGFCIGEDHVLNQPQRTFYAAADDPQQLRAGLSAVLAEAPNFDLTQFK